jgi:SPP1 family phage portal protein
MFYINRDKELNIELLQKMISKFNTEYKPRLQRYKNYYDGKQAIMNKAYADENKPCNKTVINYCLNIANCYCGYIASPSYITYNSEQDISEIMDVLRYNDYNAQDAAFLLDALIYGVAAELMYIDGAGKTRFRLINPQSCFAIYDDSLTNDMLYFVRMYEADEWDNTDMYYVDVYSDYDIKHYTMSGNNGYLTPIGEEPHYFAQCPANVFYMPDEKSAKFAEEKFIKYGQEIFRCVLGITTENPKMYKDFLEKYGE